MTPRRKMAPVNTQHLAKQLEQAAQCSIYQLYSVINQSNELQQLTASKTHPTETLRQHLLSVANWVLFFLRTPSFFRAISIALAGNPGGTPGPVEVEDPSPTMSHSFVVRVVRDDTHSAVWTRSPSRSSRASRSGKTERFKNSSEVERFRYQRP